LKIIDEKEKEKEERCCDVAVRQHDCYSFVAGGGAEVKINIQQFCIVFYGYVHYYLV